MKKFFPFYKKIMSPCIVPVLSLMGLTLPPTLVALNGMAYSPPQYQIYYQLICSVIELAELFVLVSLIGYYFKRTQSETEVQESFYQFLAQHFFPLLSYGFACLGQVILGLTLFIIPGIFRFLQLSLVPFEVFEGTATSPIKSSIKKMKLARILLNGLLLGALLSLAYLAPLSLETQSENQLLNTLFSFVLFKVSSLYLWLSYFCLCQYQSTLPCVNQLSSHKSLASSPGDMS